MKTLNMETIRNKLQEEYPLASSDFLDKNALRLTILSPELQPNLRQWVNGEPLEDIWIHETYCLRTVLNLRGDRDVCSALLALDCYARNPRAEARLFRRR